MSDEPTEGVAETGIRATQATGRLRMSVIRGAQVAGLFALAVVQPVLELVGKNPEFLIVHRLSSLQIVVGVSALVLIPFLLTTGLVLVLPKRVGALVHGMLVALMASCLMLLILSSWNAPSWLVVCSACAGGMVFSVLMTKFDVVQRLVTACSIAVVIVPVWFLVMTPASDVVRGSGDLRRYAASDFERTPPVVFLIFDELPVTHMMDSDQKIDSRNFPNFARLAASSTWYRNAAATTVETTSAVPAILTGNKGRKDVAPTVGKYPGNLFTWLGGRYSMNVDEITGLCPPEICSTSGADFDSISSDVQILLKHRLGPRRFRKSLPAVNVGWAGFKTKGAASKNPELLQPWQQRDVHFERFLDGIRGDDTTLHYLHVQLPHRYWEYLPSGRPYYGFDYVPEGLNSYAPIAHEPLADLAYRRSLAQSQYADRLLGELLDRLEKVGIADSAAVIVLSDHGASFHDGRCIRCTDTTTQTAETGYVPLFIRVPGKKGGEINDDPASGFDILPTLADILGAPLPWDEYGESMLSQHAAAPRKILDHNNEFVSNEDPGGIGRKRALDYKFSLFPEGSPFTGPLGTLRESPVPIRELTGNVNARDELEGVRVHGGSRLPALVRGWVSGTNAPVPITIAVNGKPVVNTSTYWFEEKQSFAALVQESSLRDGKNVVTLSARDPESGEITPIRMSGGAQLLGSDNDLELRVDGRVYPVKRLSRVGAVAGAADRLFDTETHVVIHGWAGDTSRDKVPQEVLLFTGKYQIPGALARENRPDLTARIGKRVGSRAGFTLTVPHETILGRQNLKVIARIGDRAYLLPWHCEMQMTKETALCDVPQ